MFGLRLCGMCALAGLVAGEGYAQSGAASNGRALALVDSAIAANGGLARLRAVEDVSIRFRGTRWMAYQSERLARPWTTQRTESDLVIDFRNDRVMRYNANRYPADFVFASVRVAAPSGSFGYDPSRRGLGDVVVRSPGMSNVGVQQWRELPAFQLLQVRDRAESVRWAGTRIEGGRRLHGVSYAEESGAVYELWIDATSKRLVQLAWLRDDPVDGDQVASYTYSGYRDERGIPVPTRLMEHRNGELVRDDSLAIAIDTRPADSTFAAPASGYGEVNDARRTGAEAEGVRKLAENVWLLQQLPGGNRVMFVAFRDYVLVLETPTPQGAATAALAAVARTVPGKPVRFVAFTHHHDDHAGGLRPYIAQGVTIVTTPTNRAFVERVATAKHARRPDALSAAPRAPLIETFRGKKVFSDGDMVVELHDIGPTSHVDEIVLAYLPRQKLVFQGDLLILPDRGEPDPANALTMDFSRALERLRLDVETIAGVHGRVGTIADLRAAVLRRTR